MEIKTHQDNLLQAIEFELIEQKKRYNSDDFSTLKQLKSLGLAIHPISISRKSFGYADYPEISFRIPFISDVSNFKDNCAIECFLEGEESVKGNLISCNAQKGDFILFAPDFPEWIEEKGVGIKIIADEHTLDSMEYAVKSIVSNSRLTFIFNEIFNKVYTNEQTIFKREKLIFKNENLNESQKNAVASSYKNDLIRIIHGPPGTGKTTTLIETIHQFILRGERVLATAPSNAAVDNLAKGLVANGIKILRLGNISKVDEAIYANTPEGKMLESKEFKDIKKLKIRAEELRKMANQYKRNFGKDERDQRKLLMIEVKNIRSEIRKIRNYVFENQLSQADVILGTPIALKDNLPKNSMFDTLIIDEAGQLLEPLAWLIFPLANRYVLAGDQFQLPPTVLSKDAIKLGFNKSILEQMLENNPDKLLLDIQYRMRSSIVAFSNSYFYNNKLKSADSKLDIEQHVLFYDTAGTGFEEETGSDGMSLMNSGELKVAHQIIENLPFEKKSITFISPYSAQIELAKQELNPNIKVKTIDSFQGQENEVIIISLVRSNNDSNIGFLTDYRRMNVAMTRAKEKLIIIGDSSTLAQDKFYEKLFNFMETINAYRSAWEFIF